MAASFLRRYPTIAAILWVVPVVAVLAVIGARDDDEFGHAAGHVAIALPVLAILVSSRRWREPDPRRWVVPARRWVLIGLAFVGVGGVLEAVGAFGFEGNARQYDALAGLHDLALLLGPIGFLFLVIGGLLTLLGRIGEGARGLRIAVAVMGVAFVAVAVRSVFG